MWLQVSSAPLLLQWPSRQKSRAGEKCCSEAYLQGRVHQCTAVRLYSATPSEMHARWGNLSKVLHWLCLSSPSGKWVPLLTLSRVPPLHQFRPESFILWFPLSGPLYLSFLRPNAVCFIDAFAAISFIVLFRYRLTLDVAIPTDRTAVESLGGMFVLLISTMRGNTFEREQLAGSYRYNSCLY